MSDFPQGSRKELAPEPNTFPKKSIGKDWGAENEAANAPNTPSMDPAKHAVSSNLIFDYGQTKVNNNLFQDPDEC